MIEPNNAILSKMLDRLFASMLNGPSMNCRPHASRQRIDLVQLAKLRDADPGVVLLQLLAKEKWTIKLAARVPTPSRKILNADEPLTPEQEAIHDAWQDQQSLRSKLRLIAEDARTYEQDTGVHALSVGFPLLSLPPGTFGGRFGIPPSRRVLAPIAFVPLTMSVKNGGTQGAIELARREGQSDIIVPNQALIAWLEKETGKPLGDLIAGPIERGEDGWRDVVELVRALAELVEMPTPEVLKTPTMPSDFLLAPTARNGDDEAPPAILPSAVLGLFPSSNQGLLRDMREMIAAGAPDGPIASFVRLGVNLDVAAATPPAAVSQPPAPDFGNSSGLIAGAAARVIASAAAEAATAVMTEELPRRQFANEKMITDADPCQARAVRMAREHRGLVIHGPPGTGKSQTITNIIADHLGRGQRVLFVCDKRTALDVVIDRLHALGLGELCAIVHDPQRDQRDLYKSVREQLDGLVDAQTKPRATEELAKVDKDLQALHGDLTQYHRLLLGQTNGGPGSFHHLVGLWLQEQGCAEVELDEQQLAESSAADLRTQGTRLKEVLERGEVAQFVSNPWKNAAGIVLADFLSTPMERYRAALSSCVQHATEVDAARDRLSPAYLPACDLVREAESRVRLAKQLVDVIEQVPAAAERAKWATRAPELVAAAGDRLSQAQEWVAAIRGGMSDSGIAEPSRVAIDQLARDRQTLGRYLASFNAIAGEYSRIRSIAGSDADDAAIFRWLQAGPRAAASAVKRLEAAETMAVSVEQTVLDPTLLARVQHVHLDAAKIAAWTAALDGYVEVTGTMFGGLHFGRKSAAEAVVKMFGRPLRAESAREVTQFLVSLQARLDLQSVIESVTGETFQHVAGDDEHLLGEFRRHKAVTSAMSKPEATTQAAALIAAAEPPAVPDEHVATINEMVITAAQPAAKVMGGYGFGDVTPKDATRLESALRRFEARARLTDIFRQVLAESGAPQPANDEELVSVIETRRALAELLLKVRNGHVTAEPVMHAAIRALKDESAAVGIINALHDSPRRAAAMTKLEETLVTTGLFDLEWFEHFSADVRGGGEALATVAALTDKLNLLEGVLRVRDGLKLLPAPLAEAAGRLLDVGANANDGYSAVRRVVLAGEITRRLKSEPNLQNVDGHRLKTTFDRYLEVSLRKKQLARDVIASSWTQRQKERLLDAGGTRLNAVGADLRRRLTGRGDKAMRLRQVIAHGAGVEGGDPFFELRPVWMASPETVAQLFPRQAIFDLIVFDEASQCRLEEALPVLTRAKRVVIAGDPKQLPPTRFFESSVCNSDDDDDAETEQELFEAHQGEIEDVLAAALGLDIHQCYLDVHYRSRHADLIGFSNEQFYGSRLQAIPEHPRTRSRHAPIRLVRADGTYSNRRNELEADAVVEVVKELLGRDNPPSIGVACFNLPQRDLIVEKLEAAAEEDVDFAAALAEARQRRGVNSSEALFVKNLENVQGDERDHLIISTTYGPDGRGRFRRNFGPVGKPGGGRRLNVLVTRAREQLHVVTSIPRGEYSSLPPIPQGATPSGTWLLFAYLNHCERIADEYETNWRILSKAEAEAQQHVNPRASKSPSQFSKALAARLVTLHNVGSDVHWGNDGFCVDLALHHPERAEDVSIGVLCDTTRYASDDPVEWEVFRTKMLEQQGWRVQRIWTPHFFRDPKGCMTAVLRDAEEALAREKGAGETEAVENAKESAGSVRSVTKRRAGRKQADQRAA